MSAIEFGLDRLLNDPELRKPLHARRLALVAVSYTHLDVSKRQSLIRRPAARAETTLPVSETRSEAAMG